MVLFWTFYNIPTDQQYCQVQLEPSIPDHDYSFNLGVQNPGEKKWLMASQDYVPGLKAWDLKIHAKHNQNVVLLVRDNSGTVKRFRFPIDNYWILGGDIGTCQTITDYRKHFSNEN